MRRFAVGVLISLSKTTTALALLACALVFVGSPGSPGSANAAPGGPPANVFVSPSGSDTGANCVHFSPAIAAPYDPSTYCATMAKAISLATNCGDVIQLAAGSYPSLTINRQATGCDSNKVVVRGDPFLPDQRTCVESQAVWQSATPLCRHGNVLMGGTLKVCGHGLSIQNMDTISLSHPFYVGENGTCPNPNGNDVESNHDIEIVNSHFTWQSTLRGHNLLLSHTRIGPQEQVCDPSHTKSDGDLLHIWPATNVTPWQAPYNVTLDHDLIYDERLGNGAGGIATHGCGWGAHTDLVQTLGYNNLVVRSSILWGSVDGIWQDGVISGTTIGNAKFINDFVGPSGIDGGGGTWQVGTNHACSGPYVYDGLTFDSNTTPALVGCSTANTNGTNSIVRNSWFLRDKACSKSGTPSDGFVYATPQYTNNGFSPTYGGSCGSVKVICNPLFLYTPTRNLGESDFAHGWDLHIAATDACVQDHGNATNYATPDIDDQARPQGAGVDIGADEVGRCGA